MAEFLIKLADERGHLLQQVETGYSESEVRDRFVQQGYLVYWVKPRGLFAAGEFRLPRRRGVKQSQFVIFNQQFLTLIKAGLPILNSLELLIKRQKDAYLQSLLENVRDRVKSGELLSTAFAAQGAFPKIYPTTLMAGEKSGNMEEVLSRYISFQRLALTFKKKLAVSLVYPALLVLFLWRWKNTDRGSESIDRVILRFPLLGQIWLKYQVANFARMLSTLLSGGLPLVQALETAGDSMSSRRILNGISEAASRVREGRTLAGSLEEQKMFPDLSVEMIEVGESTGALPAMLNSVAEFYEEDVQTALGAAMALIEPVILIVMAVVVGGILISLYLPIFTLGSNIH